MMSTAVSSARSPRKRDGDMPQRHDDSPFIAAHRARANMRRLPEPGRDAPPRSLLSACPGVTGKSNRVVPIEGEGQCPMSGHGALDAVSGSYYRSHSGS
jgi:hypothetical protein